MVDARHAHRAAVHTAREGGAGAHRLSLVGQGRCARQAGSALKAAPSRPRPQGRALKAVPSRPRPQGRALKAVPSRPRPQGRALKAAPSRPRPQGRALKAAPQLATPAWPGQTTKNGAALPASGWRSALLRSDRAAQGPMRGPMRGRSTAAGQPSQPVADSETRNT